MDVWILEDKFGVRHVLDSEEKALTYAKDYIRKAYKRECIGVYEYKTTLQDLNNREYAPFMRNVLITKKTII